MPWNVCVIHDLKYYWLMILNWDPHCTALLEELESTHVSLVWASWCGKRSTPVPVMPVGSVQGTLCNLWYQHTVFIESSLWACSARKSKQFSESERPHNSYVFKLSMWHVLLWRGGKTKIFKSLKIFNRLSFLLQPPLPTPTNLFVQEEWTGCVKLHFTAAVLIFGFVFQMLFSVSCLIPRYLSQGKLFLCH